MLFLTTVVFTEGSRSYPGYGVLKVQPLISRSGLANFKPQEGHTIRYGLA